MLGGIVGLLYGRSQQTARFLLLRMCRTELHVTRKSAPPGMSVLWFLTSRHVSEGHAHEEYAVALCVMRRTVQGTRAAAHEHETHIAPV
jgi:hypothetical protein